MKTNQEPGRSDAFNQVLSEWKVAAPLPPRFQEQVWQRIAKAERSAEQPAAGSVFWRLLTVVLPRPGFAYAYLAALLVFGMAAGSWAAQVKASHMDSQLSLRYVQAIDPYRGDTSQR